jgi:hypothetical protein
LVERLRKRAEIRRGIQSRKSVQEGKPDRIADLLEEAANAIEEQHRRGTANMSYEAWGDDDDGMSGYREQLVDAGWWCGDDVDAVKEAIKNLTSEAVYEGGDKANGVSPRFFARITLLQNAAGILEDDNPLVIEAKAMLAA